MEKITRDSHLEYGDAVIVINQFEMLMLYFVGINPVGKKRLIFSNSRTGSLKEYDEDTVLGGHSFYRYDYNEHLEIVEIFISKLELRKKRILEVMDNPVRLDEMFFV